MILQILEDRFTIDKMNAENVSIDCPWCGKGNRHFTVHVSKPVFNCWSCGVRGSWPLLIAKIEGIPLHEAERMVSRAAFFTQSDQKEIEKKEIRPVYSEIELPRKSFWTARSRSYLTGRGITHDQIDEYGFYYCRSGRERNRIILPVTMNGRTVGYQARAIDPDAEVRYLSPKGASMGRFLFNYDELNRERGPVWVVEGIFDAVAVATLGLNVVAVFGKRISEDQQNLLSEWGNLVLCFDADTLMTIEGHWYDLMNRFDVRLCPVTDGDPADAIREGRFNQTTITNIAELYRGIARRVSK